jgi:ABC-type xylose transport system permease subunit
MGYLTTAGSSAAMFRDRRNPDAATLAGINTKRTILGTFVLGVLCAIAGRIQSPGSTPA